MKNLIISVLCILLLTSGCATLTPREQLRRDVLVCIKDLKHDDTTTMDAFEVCRQVHGMKKVE